MKYGNLILAVFLLAGAAPVQAKVRADVKAGDEARHGGAFKEAAGLYTQAIKSGHIDGAALAEAYVKRGDTYRDQGLYDQAISDFAKALKTNPDLAEALNGRGLVFAKKGLYGLAIADYRAALKLKPDFAFAYTNLGRAYFYQGNFSRAAASFEDRLTIKPRHVYPMLWLYLARARMGQDPKAELAGYLANAKKGHWIYQAASLYLGKATPEQVLDAARKGNPPKRLQREAEAYFYVGQYYLVNGDKKTAAGYFRKVTATGITRFYEYTGAEVELRRLADAR
ncbi:MAG: tetratricopeptide repeat protein [Rhodospirillales bacterium]|nr:tetratricopeptide repeat protein [Rhodospirillales bacterium]